MQAPNQVPENGFYYHYKHDPLGAINNYAYEVLGVGAHTEEDGNFMVVYRPLYESSVYKAGKLFDLRPLQMWLEDVNKEGKIFPRFQKITDVYILKQLEEIKDRIYS